ncbi:MAG: SoxR reducing system RseC family protein, partial [Candidatus Omnitrophica bacterium]|nr:SoxR reducing system RseC family protein [Candidatus Omnitrophota bacterium]
MKEQGTVITRDADTATVRIEKSEACSKCCSCENARARIITVTVDKAAGVNVGDIVEIEVSPSTMLKTYCFIYLF